MKQVRVGKADMERFLTDDASVSPQWMIEHDGSAVATGGALHHYNPPYADLFMEVAEPFRRRGYGSCMVQELKRIGDEMGDTPATRCPAGGVASNSGAGMLPCGRILIGQVVE